MLKRMPRRNCCSRASRDKNLLTHPQLLPTAVPSDEVRRGNLRRSGAERKGPRRGPLQGRYATQGRQSRKVIRYIKESVVTCVGTCQVVPTYEAVLAVNVPT